MPNPPVSMIKEWHGSPVPTSIATPLPTTAELVSLCKQTNRFGYTMGMPYPPEAESLVFWIKYGSSVVWNELAAQKFAFDGLKTLHSPVKILIANVFFLGIVSRHDKVYPSNKQPRIRAYGILLLRHLARQLHHRQPQSNRHIRF